MSNKPILPNAYVDINNRNLGMLPVSQSGIFAFAGIAVEGSETAESIVTVGGLNEVREKIGYGNLADDLIDFFQAGGRRALAYPIVPTTEGTIGAVTPTRVGTSTGTITLLEDGSKMIPCALSLKFEITKSGSLGEGKFKYSTDGGLTYSPETLIPSAGTYTIPGTNIVATFVPGAGAVYFEDGDTHAAAVTAPVITDAKIEGAVDAFIVSDETLDAIVVSNPAGAALVGSVKAKVLAAEAKPNFRYCYGMVRPAISASAAGMIVACQSVMAAVSSDRIQVVASELNLYRPNHANDIQPRNVIGLVAGRRSALAISDDLGLFSAGELPNVESARTGWTDTTIEDLDGLRAVTVRKFKGVAGWRPTNGWMIDPFSDVKKCAWRLILDKASNLARLAGLSFLKMKVDPADVQGSTKALKDNIQGALNVMVGDRDIVQASVEIPADQDILTTEEILVEVGIIPYGHASFIGITIGLVNPLRA